MGSTWQDLPVLFRHPLLWKQVLLPKLMNRSWFLGSRLATTYRRTVVQGTRVVAVVGSLGKSTTTRAVAAALGYDLPRTYQIGFANAYPTVGLRILGIHPGAPHMVIEVGIKYPGQMAPIAQMLRPDVAVVTSIMTEHQRSFHTLERTRAEKVEMVRALPASGTAVLNGDDPNVLWMKDLTRASVVTYGLDTTNDIQASNISLNWPEGMRFQLRAYAETRDASIRLLGRHQVYPALAAVAVALIEGRALDQVVNALGSLPPTTGRLQPVQCEDGTIILRDDAKTGLESIEAALDLLSEIPAPRRGVVLGDLTDPVGDPVPTYRHIGRRVAEISCFGIFCGTSPATQAYLSGTSLGGLPPDQFVQVRGPVSEAASEVVKRLEPGDVVLVKGISSQRLARVSLALEGRAVRCDRLECLWAILCDHCPRLERG